MKVSIVVPVYNSALMLKELIHRISKTMDSIDLKNDFELILINDFSSDNSWSVIEGLILHNSFIKGINLTDNFGQHNAIMAGLNNCEGDFIITIDDDLQHQPEFIPDILKTLREFDKDVCYTNYKNRKHIGWKRLVSNLNNIVSSFILNKPLEIYMSSYRGLTKKLKTEIINYKQSNVYIDGLIITHAKKIGMINIDHEARKYGESNYNLKKLFILWSNMFLNFSFFPFRAASIFGIVVKFIVKSVRKKNNKPQYEISEIKSNNEQ